MFTTPQKLEAFLKKAEEIHKIPVNKRTIEQENIIYREKMLIKIIDQLYEGKDVYISCEFYK